MRLVVWTKARPILALFLLFIAWKFLILLIVLLSPGIGYDTSTSQLQHVDSHGVLPNNTVTTSLSLPYKLVRWDAIYYIKLAQRGHLFEQEWAFGIGMSTIVSHLTRFINITQPPELEDFILMGIIASHVAHWFSVVLTWMIAAQCINRNSHQDFSISFIAAVLQIMSPAGVFLSAPFSESLFACLNNLGFYLYISDGPYSAISEAHGNPVRKILAGLVFGSAVMIRSNGLFSGLPFLLDASSYAAQLANLRPSSCSKPQLLLNLQSVVLGGACIAVGMVFPQFIAYRQYCIGVESPRPWCGSLPPSIYTFVQAHYWNVGFLRYWTLSNLPLFLLATPMLYLLIHSAIEACRTNLISQPNSLIIGHTAVRLALPQLLLALLAITNFHVQIITRLASAYPFWYIWMAVKMQEWKYSSVAVRTLVLYGLLQAGLYASFLPPA